MAHQAQAMSGLSHAANDKPTLRMSSSSLSSSSLPETLVGALVQTFGECLDSVEHDIDLEQLLEACRCYKKNLLAVGQHGSAHDIGQNIQKVEESRMRAPLQHRKTLRSLLEYEKARGVRPRAGGTLQNPSGAMGLLWLRRTLSFQYRFNLSLVEQPRVPAVDAALEAYRVEGEPFHSWGLQQVFKLGFRTTIPVRSRVLAEQWGEFEGNLDDYQEAMVLQQLTILSEIWEPVRDKQLLLLSDLAEKLVHLIQMLLSTNLLQLLRVWKSIFESLDLEDPTKA